MKLEQNVMWNTKKRWRASAVSAAALLGIYLAGPFDGIVAKSTDLDQRLPAPLLDEAPKGTGTETLILAGGCFWGVQGVFQHVRGVVSALFPATTAVRPARPNMRL
jgi:peptide-methionine (S)-S-oxide reductase